MNQRPHHAILLAILVVLVLGLVLVALPHVARKITDEPQQATTTTSTVAQMTESDWLTSTSTGLTFRYPAQLPTTYMHATDWPPKVTFTFPSGVTCTTHEDEMGRTAARTVDGAQYCVTELSEGAAGSTYTTYTYVTNKDGKNVNLTFTLRSVQCLNYNEPEAGVCQKERQDFSVDALAAKLVNSIQYK